MQDHFSQSLKSLLDKDFEIFAVSESWFSRNIPSSAVNIRYNSILKKDRDNRGGGVTFYVESNLSVKKVSIDFASRELKYLFIEIKISKCVFAIGVVYRLPCVNVSSSVDGFENVMSHITAEYSNVILLGDVESESSQSAQLY